MPLVADSLSVLLGPRAAGRIVRDSAGIATAIDNAAVADRRLAAVMDVARAYLQDRALRSDVLKNPEAVGDYCRILLAGRKNESLHVIFVNNRNAAIADRTLFEGSAGEAACYPRRIAEEALLCGATGIILVHNHPSGQVSPSPNDRNTTDAVAKALRTLDIRMLDHVIIAREGRFSFREAGLLAEYPA